MYYSVWCSHVDLSIYSFIHLCACWSIHQSIRAFSNVQVSITSSIIHVQVLVHPSICPSIHSSIHPSIHLLVHSSIHFSIHPFIHPTVHPFTCPFIYSCTCTCICTWCIKEIHEKRPLVTFINPNYFLCDILTCRTNTTNSKKYVVIKKISTWIIYCT